MAFGDRNSNKRPREYYKAVCSECGRECEVPFRPTQGKAVYCNDCYKLRAPPKDDRRRRF